MKTPRNFGVWASPKTAIAILHKTTVCLGASTSDLQLLIPKVCNCHRSGHHSLQQLHVAHRSVAVRSAKTLAYHCTMSADPIIYCLERVSDYRDFERLCSALLASAGYPRIDPLGGTGDEGRDAIIKSDEAGLKISFAYTVRSDWRVKLASDCKRVHDKGHDPDLFVFVCTEALSASEKDFAHKSVAEKYGWKLDLFDLERLRVQLVGPQRYLIAQHPSIFTPPFFPQRGGQSVAESRDTLLIDHVASDHALATWLARRLSLAGFRTWCHGTAPLAGENADETVRKLLEARASHYLPVISTTSLSDTMFLERCTIAATKEDPSFAGCHAVKHQMQCRSRDITTDTNPGLATNDLDVPRL